MSPRTVTSCTTTTSIRQFISHTGGVSPPIPIFHSCPIIYTRPPSALLDFLLPPSPSLSSSFYIFIFPLPFRPPLQPSFRSTPFYSVRPPSPSVQGVHLLRFSRSFPFRNSLPSTLFFPSSPFLPPPFLPSISFRTRGVGGDVPGDTSGERPLLERRSRLHFAHGVCVRTVPDSSRIDNRVRWVYFARGYL